VAKKATKRERKEEARRRRLEEMRRRQRRTQLRKLYTWGVVVAAIGGVVLWVVLAKASSNRAKQAGAKLAASAGCNPAESKPIEGSRPTATHVTPPQRVTYNTNPPNSGNHYAGAGAPAPTGILAQAPQDEQLVHNLEHGHVIIWYQSGQIADSILVQLQQLVRSDASHLVLVPRPAMPFKLALSAWGVIQGCPNPNEKVVDVAKDFKMRFANHGPETISGQPVFQTTPPVPVTPPTPSPTTSPTAGSPTPSPSPTATST
jgi:hypothetical protein